MAAAPHTPDLQVPHILRVVGAWSWRILLGVAVAVLGMWILLQLFVVVVPIILALFLASVLEPPVEWLRHHRWPSALAAAAVFLATLLAVVGVMAWLGSSVAGEFGELGAQIDRGIDDVKEWLTGEPFNLDREQVDRFEEGLRSSVSLSDTGFSQRLIGRARQVAEVLSAVVLTLFTLFFLLKDGKKIGAWLRDRIPGPYVEEVTAMAGRARGIMRSYLAATALTGLIDAVLIAVVLIVTGTPVVVPLAVLTFLGGFFPLIGAFVAGLIAALVAFVNGGVLDGLIVTAATVLVQQIEGNLLQPVILERQVKLHALVTTWAVTGGLILGGLLGGFLAVPLVAIGAQIANYYRTRTLPTPPPGSAP